MDFDEDDSEDEEDDSEEEEDTPKKVIYICLFCICSVCSCTLPDSFFSPCTFYCCQPETSNKKRPVESATPVSAKKAKPAVAATPQKSGE